MYLVYLGSADGRAGIETEAHLLCVNSNCPQPQLDISLYLGARWQVLADITMVQYLLARTREL